MKFMKDVQSYNNEIEIKGGKPVEVSRRKLKEVVEKFKAYNKV
jgi:hypothetical protein